MKVGQVQNFTTCVEAVKMLEEPAKKAKVKCDKLLCETLINWVRNPNEVTSKQHEITSIVSEYDEPDSLNEIIEIFMERVIFLENKATGGDLAGQFCLRLLEAGKTKKALRLIVSLGVERSILPYKTMVTLATRLLPELAKSKEKKVHHVKDVLDRLVYFLFYSYFELIVPVAYQGLSDEIQLILQNYFIFHANNTQESIVEDLKNFTDPLKDLKELLDDLQNAFILCGKERLKTSRIWSDVTEIAFKTAIYMSLEGCQKHISPESKNKCFEQSYQLILKAHENKTPLNDSGVWLQLAKTRSQIKPEEPLNKEEKKILFIFFDRFKKGSIDIPLVAALLEFFNWMRLRKGLTGKYFTSDLVKKLLMLFREKLGKGDETTWGFFYDFIKRVLELNLLSEKRYRILFLFYGKHFQKKLTTVLEDLFSNNLTSPHEGLPKLRQFYIENFDRLDSDRKPVQSKAVQLILHWLDSENPHEAVEETSCDIVKYHASKEEHSQETFTFMYRLIDGIYNSEFPASLHKNLKNLMEVFLFSSKDKKITSSILKKYSFQKPLCSLEEIDQACKNLEKNSSDIYKYTQTLSNIIRCWTRSFKRKMINPSDDPKTFEDYKNIYDLIFDSLLPLEEFLQKKESPSDEQRLSFILLLSSFSGMLREFYNGRNVSGLDFQENKQIERNLFLLHLYTEFYPEINKDFTVCYENYLEDYDTILDISIHVINMFVKTFTELKKQISAGNRKSQMDYDNYYKKLVMSLEEFDSMISILVYKKLEKLNFYGVVLLKICACLAQFDPLYIPKNIGLLLEHSQR